MHNFPKNIAHDYIYSVVLRDFSGITLHIPTVYLHGTTEAPPWLGVLRKKFRNYSIYIGSKCTSHPGLFQKILDQYLGIHTDSMPKKVWV